MNEIKTGSVVGTGAAINISMGFVPDYFKIVNTTDADAIHEWFKGMAAGTAIETTTAVAPLAANGVTAYNGSDVASQGVTIGSTISESGKTLRWFASRHGAGAQ